MNWTDVSEQARATMKELGNFGPTVHAANREVKGVTVDDEGVVKTYWNSSDLREIAAHMVEVAEWLERRAAAAAAQERA